MSEPDFKVSTTYNKPSSPSASTNQETSSGMSTGASYKYPLENQELYKAAIKFSVHSVNPYEVDINAAQDIIDVPFIFGDKSSSSKVSPSEGTNMVEEGDFMASRDARLSLSSDARFAALALEGSKAQIGLSGRSLGLQTKDLSKGVLLYFPPGVVIQDQATYANQDLNIGGTGTLAGARAANGGLLSSMARGSLEGLNDMFGLIGSSFSSQEAAQIAAIRAVEKIKFIKTDVSTGAKIALQRVINPNTRTVFQGVAIKSYSFTFKLIATSADEAEQINQIIKLFRTELYPESVELGGIPLGYKFPHVFKIRYQYNGADNKNIPQPLFCYLRDVSTTYNSSNNMSFHADGNATEIDMTLNFQEYRAMSRQDVENPYGGGK